MKKINLTLFAVLAIILFQRCNNIEEPKIDPSQMSIENMVVPEIFNYSTTKEIEVALTVPAYLKNAVVSIEAVNGIENLVVSKGTFDEAGYSNSKVVVPAYTDTLVIRSGYIGLIDGIVIPLNGKKATFDYRPLYSGNQKSSEIQTTSLKSASNFGYTYMGTYNTPSGVPNYLVTSDVIEQGLLDDINSSLPERKKVPDLHPEYIAEGTQTNIVLTKAAEVWVTFVHEGAGYLNSLGYYTYKEGQEPKLPLDIKQLTIIYPNLSLSGSGGGLNPGNKVYLGKFEANTVISWFLVANGWNNKEVTKGYGTYYSQPELNPEKKKDKKNHMVLLLDNTRKLLLMGFEDINREGNSDEDFNDAVYYATVNPIDAVKTDDVEEIEKAKDTDGDGIIDELDEFPNDPLKAFNNFSPNVGKNGTLVYEDLWPSKGDYDFNDLVVGYNFNLIANGANKVTTIEASFDIKQIGASYKNGFAFVMPIKTEAIKSIEGQQMNVGYTSLKSNGTESGVDETVVFVTENVSAFKGKTIKIVITLQNPVLKDDVVNVPFNPFIVVNGDRGREVHLPDMAPTSKGKKLLGQKDDDSSIESGRYYKTQRNLPWALNFYTDFVTPDEKVSIDKPYPRFVNWAYSGGTQDLDWYIKK